MNPKDQIKQTLSILDVVSTYVRLEKAGSQYKGRCPFHNEKTPSFFVSPDRGTYHCFGCAEHGDIFSFVEKMEAVPFYEALTILAERAGVKLTPFKKEEKDKESNLISLLQKANKYYEENLEKSIEAKMYLGERAIANEIIKKFNIGFSIGGESGWRDIFINLSKDGFTPEEMIEAGLVIKKEAEPATHSVTRGTKYFDRFRGRIMFPIKNTFGNIVGYSARILPKYQDEKSAKYINSPETSIYHKSKILFGYDLAKKSIAEKKEAIIVEGQMDLIMSHQAGVENIVATSGTAVGEEHIKILKRFADKVLLSFDQDTAGEEAMKKCGILALYGGLDVYVIPKKEGVKDVADLIKDFGGEVWKDLISKKVHLIEYLLNNVFVKTEDERERGILARKEILPFLRAIESDIDRAYFIKYLAGKLNVQDIDIVNDLKKIKVDEIKEIGKAEENVNKENNLSGKEVSLIQILSILRLKEIDLEKFSNKFIKEESLPIDFVLEFEKDKDNFPEEFLERDIIKMKEMLSKNPFFLEDEKKYFNRELEKQAIKYKFEIVLEKLKEFEKKKDKTDEDMRSMITLARMRDRFDSEIKRQN